MSFTKTLARLGLVELTDEEKANLKDEAPAMSAEEIAELARGGEPALEISEDAPALDPANSATEIDESRTFEGIYAIAQIPDSPFAADKLFKLLEGLKSLPKDVRKQAVVAMDEAEEGWTIADSLVDAQRKIDALNDERNRVSQHVTQIVQSSEAAVQEKEEYGRQASAEIRKQIADLELLLEQELAKTAAECETLKSGAHAAQQAGERVRKRYQEESDRLAELAQIFGESNIENSNG